MLHRELLGRSDRPLFAPGSLKTTASFCQMATALLLLEASAFTTYAPGDVAGNLDVAGCRLIAGLRSDQRIALSWHCPPTTTARRPAILGGITSGVGQSVPRAATRNSRIRLGTRVIQHAARHGLQQLIKYPAKLWRQMVVAWSAWMIRFSLLATVQRCHHSSGWPNPATKAESTAAAVVIIGSAFGLCVAGLGHPEE